MAQPVGACIALEAVQSRLECGQTVRTVQVLRMAVELPMKRPPSNVQVLRRRCSSAPTLGVSDRQLAETDFLETDIIASGTDLIVRP